MEPTYNVYMITDGAVYDEESLETLERASQVFDNLVQRETEARAHYYHNGMNYAETTVHLYDAFYGNMLAETCITAA